MLSSSQKTHLLQLARETIESYTEHRDAPEVNADELDAALKENRATFVTLTIGSELRGCIGSLVARQPLYLDIMSNAINAATHDPRFSPLKEDELKKIKIEISILTPPKILEYKDSEDLLNKLVPRRDGVILSDGYDSATYLPQVWEDLTDKAEFLDSLCLKAGLPENTWRKKKPTIQVYQVEKFRE